MTNEFSLAPLFRSSIGFDRLNDFVESALRMENAPTYPPYNVEKHGDDDYRIVVAAAGLKDGDLEVQVERDVLTITGGRREKESETTQYLHKGIAQRAFKLSYRLADYIEVKGAKLEHGLLSVDLVRRIPEAAKPRRITIGQGSAPAVNQDAAQPSNTVSLDRKAAAA